MTAAIQALDESILLYIQAHIRCAALTPLMKVMSFLGNAGIGWIVLGVALLIYPKTRRAGLDLLLCLALASALNGLGLKNLVARPRPFLTMDDLTVLVSAPSGYSFPSGHSCAAFAAAYALARSFRRGGWAYLPAALIALSRIYVGVHYPSDILVGALIGTLAAMVVYWLSHRVIKEKVPAVKE